MGKLLLFFFLKEEESGLCNIESLFSIHSSDVLFLILDWSLASGFGHSIGDSSKSSVFLVD